MSQLPDPPLKEKDHSHSVWVMWFQAIKRAFGQDHIADASTSHAVNSWATTNTALNALGTKINTVLSELEEAGILKES